MTTPEDSVPPTPAPFTPPSTTQGSAGSTPGGPTGTGPGVGDDVPGWGAPAPGQPRFGQYAPPGGPPAGGGYPAAPAEPAASGWQSQPSPYGAPMGFGGPAFRAPSAKPGIIPLRPLSLGEIYDGAFGAIRSNPKVMLGVVALVIAVATILSAIVGYAVAPTVNSWLAGSLADIDPDDLLEVRTLGPEISVSLVTALGVYLASVVTTGLLIVAIGRAVINRPYTAADLWSEVRGKIVGLFVISLVPGVVLGVVVIALILLVALVAVTAGDGAAGVVGLFLAFALIPFILWFAMRVLLAPAAYVLEKQGIVSAFRRGWRLSRGSFWRLLGIYLLSNIIVNIVVGIIAVPGVIISSLVFTDGGWGALAVSVASNIVAYTITTAFLSAVVALLYIDVRMRREGLDVELAAAADEV